MRIDYRLLVDFPHALDGTHEIRVLAQQMPRMRCLDVLFGIDQPPFQAPRANAFCERLIATVRRECVDFLIPLNERHLRSLLKEWVTHYNRGRPHSSLGPGIPDLRSGHQRAKLCGHRVPIDHQVVAKAMLGGLHHEYSLERRTA